MTQPDDPPSGPIAVTAPSRYDEPRSRLFQVAAVVGIVAGSVFVVAVVFFTGFFLGASSSGYGGSWRPAGHMGPGGRVGTCPMINGGDGTPSGPMMPGGVMGPGMMGPGSATSTPAPSTPRP